MATTLNGNTLPTFLALASPPPHRPKRRKMWRGRRSLFATFRWHLPSFDTASADGSLG